MKCDLDTDLLSISPVIPVVVIRDRSSAVPLAKALVAGGIGIIEVTLRTAVGLAAIEDIAREVPDILVGAGTVISTEQIGAVIDSGAQFVVTPGSPPHLMDALAERAMPVLPGASTVSESMALLDRGYRALKFFPAEQTGGVGYLTALSGPLPQARFCPTGGITVGNAPQYLALPNVGCVGGSWLTPAQLLADRDWAAVTALAQAAAKLRP